jgi:hypothetical protein
MFYIIFKGKIGIIENIFKVKKTTREAKAKLKGL